MNCNLNFRRPILLPGLLYKMKAFKITSSIICTAILVFHFNAFRQELQFPKSASFQSTPSIQGRSEVTLSVPFQVLIFHCQIDFINLFIFNCLTSDIYFFIFNCLMSDINLFFFNCLRSNFCFPKIIPFASRTEQLFMDARPQFRILNSSRKMMICYLRDTNKFDVFHPVHEYTRIQILNKRHQTNTVCTF